MTLACVATGLISYTGPSWLAIPVVILFGATASSWNGVFLAEVMREVKPAEVGFATSGSLMFTYFGVRVGPPLFGLAAAFVGFRAPMRLQQFWLWLEVTSLGACDLGDHDLPARRDRAAPNLIT